MLLALILACSDGIDDTGIPVVPLVELVDLEGPLEELATVTAPHGDRRATGPGIDAARALAVSELEAHGWTVTESAFSWGVPLRTATNLLAELPGSGDGVVLVGAHLDTVRGSPGMNDNGTGVATVLALAQALHDQGLAPVRTVRLALWTWEEAGFLGSYRYLNDLSAAERDRIDAYVNVDMTGSYNGLPYVHDGDGSEGGPAGAAGSAALEARLTDWLEDQGSAWEPLEIAWNFDLIYFLDHDIPMTGVFAGAGDELSEEQAALHGGMAGALMDDCYHTACDDLDNVDLDRATLLAEAVAHALEGLAAGDEL